MNDPINLRTHRGHITRYMYDAFWPRYDQGLVANGCIEFAESCVFISGALVHLQTNRNATCTEIENEQLL